MPYKNKEKARLYYKKRYNKNKKVKKELNDKYYKKNREYYSEYGKKYREEHKKPFVSKDELRQENEKLKLKIQYYEEKEERLENRIKGILDSIEEHFKK